MTKSLGREGGDLTGDNADWDREWRTSVTARPKVEATASSTKKASRTLKNSAINRKATP